jgi:hypothetical protein
MVVRKPASANTSGPVSTSSSTHPNTVWADPPSNESSNQIGDAIRDASAGATSPSTQARPYPRSPVQQSSNVVSQQAELRPYISEKDPAERPLPVGSQLDRTATSFEELRIELSDSPRPGLSASEKITPRSSIDSGSSREFWDDIQGDGHASDEIPSSQPSSRPERTPSSMSEPIVASTAQRAAVPHLPKVSNLHTTNPFRRKVPSNTYPSSAPPSSGNVGGQEKSKSREVDPLRKTTLHNHLVP